MNTSLRVRPAAELALPDKLPGSPAALERPPTHIGRIILLLVLCVAALWGGFGSWATLVPIQSAVVAVGRLEVEGDLPTVQHLEGGLIREIRVTEGQHVEKGETLIVLADTMSSAQDRILMNQLVSALAQDQRLAAELRGDSELTLSDELAQLIAIDPAFVDLFASQRALFLSNNAMWLGQEAILEERVADLEKQFEGLGIRHATLLSRLDFIQAELTDLKTLYDKKLITKTRYVNQQDAEVSLIGDLSVLESQLDSVRQRIAEIEQRILQVRRDRASGLSAEQQQVKERIFDIRQRIVANQDVKDRSVVRAPVTGRVLGLSVTGPGEVIQDGEDIMKIVPDGASYIVEGRIRPEDVDQVAEGNVARVRLTAYNFRTTPPVEGTVSHVSADSLTDLQTGLSYYQANVRISDEALAALPGVDVQPGMPAQIMIATGEQTVANYILGPIFAGFNSALRESN